jgi:tRNA1(Val) A37 N6-methylase TrmN6
VADLGAGAGAAGLAVAARLAAAEVVLVERSPQMADYAGARLPLNKTPLCRGAQRSSRRM